MRRIFIIYLAASLTLLFAGANVVANLSAAHLTKKVIITLKPTGDDLERMQSYYRNSLSLAAQSSVVVIFQLAIIFCAGSINKQRGAV